MTNWQGKRYWLVGASEGLGREVAFCLSRAGAEVIVSARSEDRLKALVADLPGKASYVTVDVTDRAAVEAAARHGAFWYLRDLVGLCDISGHRAWQASMRLIGRRVLWADWYSVINLNSRVSLNA